MMRINRRQALAGAAVGMPLLASLLGRRALGDAVVFPKRLIIFFTPNGTNPESWFPTPGASERDFTLHGVMAPLQPHRDFLLPLQGINMESLQPGPGEPHQRGMGAVLCGDHLQEGAFVGGDGSLAGWGNGTSVDQVVASAIGGSTRKKSLELGVRVLGSEVRHRINYAGPAQPLPPRNDPRAVWDEIFANLMQPSNDALMKKAQRRGILSAVNQNFVTLRDKVSTADRIKLDQHREAVRDMERRLAAVTVLGDQCMQPSRPPPMDPDAADNMDDTSSQHIDLAVMALACDITRVVTIQHSSGANNIPFPFLQSFTDDHVLSHAGETDLTSRQEWAMRQTWYAGQFARLLSKLRAVQEGSGTLLDNSLILWCSELSQGSTHSHANMPFLLAGKAGGAINPGRYLQFNGKRHNDLLVSIMNAMGVPGDTYGDPNFCSGALPGLG